MAKFIWDKAKKKAVPESEYIPPTETIFPAMTDEQLSEYAAMKGVDISRAKTRETVIAKLEKAEQGE